MGPVLHPGSQLYDEDNGSYFGAFEIEMKSSYIVEPTSVKQGQDQIRILRPPILSGKCSSYHSRGRPHALCRQCQYSGRRTINTKDLNSTKLSQGNSSMEIAVGRTWAVVCSELAKHGFVSVQADV